MENVGSEWSKVQGLPALDVLRYIYTACVLLYPKVYINKYKIHTRRLIIQMSDNECGNDNEVADE